jgi:hypothetical protein
MRFFRWALAACSISVACCLCVETFLKSALRSDCVDGNISPRNSVPSSVVILSLVFASLAFIANFVFLLFKSRSQQGYALVGLICSKWQPVYFVILSIERLIFNALIVRDLIRSEHVGACSSLSIEVQNQTFAAAFIWNAAIFCGGLSILCCDLDADFTPYLRRCSYAFFCIFSVLDAVGSYIWGNTLAARVNVSVGSFKFILDTQISSCISSQVLISLQLLFVSYRSHNGLAWAYAPLRFQLVESEIPSQLAPALSTPLLKHVSINHPPNVQSLSIEAAASASNSVSNHSNQRLKEGSSVLLRIYQHFLLFRTQQLERSAVYTLPCISKFQDGVRVTHHTLQVARPLFRLSFLQPLHRLSGSFSQSYICSTACVMLASFGLSFASHYGEGVSILVAFLNLAVLILTIGFFSAAHHNFDKIAAKHVASSFRFSFSVLLCTVWLALFFRWACLGRFSFWIFAGIVAIVPLFFLCTLADCSPHLSVFVQLCISVRTSVTRPYYFFSV